MKQLRDHIQEEISVYESYSPTDVSHLKNALLYTEKNFVILIVSGDSERIRQTLTGFLNDPSGLPTEKPDDLSSGKPDGPSDGSSDDLSSGKTDDPSNPLPSEPSRGTIRRILPRLRGCMPIRTTSPKTARSRWTILRTPCLSAIPAWRIFSPISDRRTRGLTPIRR